MTTVLVTGGAGYIGAHICVELLAQGYEAIVLDNFCNSKPEALRRVARISGKAVNLVEGDIRDASALTTLFANHDIRAVIHLAGLKAVGDSVADPAVYYDNNVVGSLRLIEQAQKSGVEAFIFSSSATVYGAPQYLPYDEAHPLSPESPYGRTKYIVEGILDDVASVTPNLQSGILRYFNPIGAHPSGLIGEDPRGTPNNLLPFIAQVAVGRRAALNVWGKDYPTLDGTGRRDYIHVVDLARAHVSALRFQLSQKKSFVLNLGSGESHSVLEVVSAFETASGQAVPLVFGPRRGGDIDEFYADPSEAERVLGWKVEYDLARMCVDHWRWQKANPNGYAPDECA